MNVLVSIIVPIFNVESYIEKCARSLFEQTYDNLQFVFVNDCTQDNSLSILQSVIKDYPSISNRVKIVSHANNKGLAVARNTGVLAAEGVYVMHVDSDDTIERNTVEMCIDKAETEKADAVVFGMRHIKENGSYIEHIHVPADHQLYIKQLIEREAVVCMCGGLYKRTLYLDNNVWAIPGLNMGEDYSTKPRLLYYAKKVVALDAPFYNYNHLNEKSYTQSFNSNRIDNIQKAIDVLSKFFNEQQDSEVYKKSLQIASLSSKVILLKLWGVSDSSRHDFDRIKIMYEDLNINCVKSFVDRVLLQLAKKDYALLVRVVVKTGIIIKSMFR